MIIPGGRHFFFWRLTFTEGGEAAVEEEEFVLLRGEKHHFESAHS